MTVEDYALNWRLAREKALKQGLRVVEIGWEQHVIIDEAKGIVFRYPRHQAAVAKLADEVKVLHDVNEHKWPIKLPVMLEHNEIFTSYTYIPGEVLTPAIIASLNPNSLIAIGAEIGSFLAQFHQLDHKIVDQKYTKHTTTLLEYYDGRICSAEGSQFYVKAFKALQKLKNLQNEQIKRVVLHGDIHGPNVVVDLKTEKLAGVIDLSEMEVGDPHQEFRKIFMTYPTALNPALEAYESSGGQTLNSEAVIQWAYVNEWANACFFSSEPENPTYVRAMAHLHEWQQL